jgi:3-polyprenyl-4-hydroxybenzoate decarboxylase
MRLISSMPESSGVIYGIRMLQLLAERKDVETHWVGYRRYKAQHPRSRHLLNRRR